MKPRFQSIMLSVLSATLLFSAAACSGAVPLSTPTSASNALTEANNGKTVTLKVGETLVVRLASNPSTGYTWETKDLDTQMLEQVGEAAFESPETPPDLVGAGGTLVLTFKALEPGTTTLTLVYHRPWETDVAPLQTFSVTVTVK
jgi:inhibitor of cysteine peptidase